MMRIFAICIFSLGMMFIMPAPPCAAAGLTMDQNHDRYNLNSFLEIADDNGAPALGVKLVFEPYEGKLRWISTSQKIHWYRFTVDNQTKVAQPMILTNAFQMVEMMLVHPQFPLAPSWMGHHHLDRQYQPSLFPSTKLVVLPGRSTYLLGVNSGGHPEVIALFLATEVAYLNGLKIQVPFLLVTAGLLIGIAAYGLAILIGLRTRLQWINLIVSLCTVLFAVSLIGLLTYFRLPGASPILEGWMMMMGCMMSSFCWYIIDFYPIKRKDYPVLWYLLVLMSVLFVLLPCLRPFYPKVVLELFVFSAFVSGLLFLCVFVRFSRNDPLMGGLFTIAFLPNISGFMVLGVEIAGLVPFSPFILSVLFAFSADATFFITIAMSVRSQRLDKRAVQTEQAISLGKSVQDLLLPAATSGSYANCSYQFRYAPYRGSMSGDWIQSWRTENGGMSLMLGDVTGKGPQAAITVAAIAAIISMHKAEHGPLDTPLIQQINNTLVDMFGGRVNSTISAVHIQSDGTMTLYNTGGLGWFLVRGSSASCFMLRSDLVGVDHDCQIGVSSLVPLPGDILLTISDGICNSSAGLHRTLRRMATSEHMEPILESYADRLWSLPGELEDDRALVILQAYGADASVFGEARRS